MKFNSLFEIFIQSKITKTFSEEKLSDLALISTKKHWYKSV
jgi:hypothetical protein